MNRDKPKDMGLFVQEQQEEITCGKRTWRVHVRERKKTLQAWMCIADGCWAEGANLLHGALWSLLK